jgi:hypothetical protein
MILEHRMMNICSYISDLLVRYKLRGYQVVINYSVCLTDKYYWHNRAYVRRETREFSKPHLPSLGTQIYLMSQLNCEGADRIISIGFHRCITERFT